MQISNTQKGALINSNALKETTLRKRETEPGLIAFYNIQPGIGAGLFLQPRSLYGVAV